MKKNVLVALANESYLDQAKQLFSTAFWNSGWTGDYLLLAYKIPESSLSWFLEKGILIKNCEPLNCGSEKIGDIITACKCYLFTEFFKHWEIVIYLDVDIVTRGSIDGLTNIKQFSACYSLGQTLKDNLVNDVNIPSQVHNEIINKYDLQSKAFNSGVMVFPSSIIHENMFIDILAVFSKYVRYGTFGGDQLPFNLYFYNKWQELPPAYNQIATLFDSKLSRKSLVGLIIHCVCFGNGPWDMNCIVHEEWKANLKKAELIDFKLIPTIASLREKEIKKISNTIVRSYFLGGDVSFINFINSIKKIIEKTIQNPKKMIAKLKTFLHF